MRRVAGGLKREITDLDHDGTVTLSEFLDSTAAWHEAIDTNGDGVVTRRRISARETRHPAPSAV